MTARNSVVLGEYASWTRPLHPWGVAAELYGTRRLCREARRRLPDVRRAENEGQGAEILDLSLHDQSEASRQRLWSRDAEQASGGDPRYPRGKHDIDPLHARKTGWKSFYASLGFVEAGRDRDGEMIAVLKL